MWFWEESRALYLLCALFFIIIVLRYNEIIVLIVTHNNAESMEPLSFFSLTRWSHLGLMGDSGNHSPVQASIPTQIIRHYLLIRSMKQYPSHMQLTVGFVLL